MIRFEVTKKSQLMSPNNPAPVEISKNSEYHEYTEKLFILIFTIVFFNLGKNVSL